MKYSIPGTAREIIECLTTEQNYSIKQIARMLGVCTKTIYRIRRGYSPGPKIHLNLIHFYLKIIQSSDFEKHSDLN